MPLVSHGFQRTKAGDERQGGSLHLYSHLRMRFPPVFPPPVLSPLSSLSFWAFEKHVAARLGATFLSRPNGLAYLKATPHHNRLKTAARLQKPFQPSRRLAEDGSPHRSLFLSPPFVFFGATPHLRPRHRAARNSTRDSTFIWYSVNPINSVASIHAAAVAGPNRRNRNAL